MLNKLEINNKLKKFLWGLTMVILVSLFTYIVVKIFNDRSDAKYQASLEKINSNSEKRKLEITKILDSAQQRIDRNYNAVNILNNDFKKYNTNLNKYQLDLSNSLNQLNKIKDEKNYVPINATISEQSSYISGYKYQPY